MSSSLFRILGNFLTRQQAKILSQHHQQGFYLNITDKDSISTSPTKVTNQPPIDSYDRAMFTTPAKPTKHNSQSEYEFPAERLVNDISFLKPL
jgi:hypothetical protein